MEGPSYSILGIYKQIISQNLKLFLQNILLEAILPPLEILLFTKISTTLLEDLKKDKLKVLNPRNQKFISFLIFLQYFHEYNRRLLNKIREPIRINIRELLYKIKQNNEKIMINVIFMPIAIVNGYYYSLTYILPMVVLFVYTLCFVCKYNWKIGIASTIYVFINFLFLILKTISLSKEAKDMFLEHGKILRMYDNEKDNYEKIKIKENKYEKLRFKFYEGVNKFIFFQTIMFYVYCIIIVGIFAKMKHCQLSTIITSLLFIARYYNVILIRSTLFIESVARLTILNDKLK